MAKKKRKTTGKSSLTLSLSSQARERLAEMAQKAGYSRSAFVESVMAGKVAIATVEPEKSLEFTFEEGSAEQQKIGVEVVEETTIASSTGLDNSNLEEIQNLQAKIEEQAEQISQLQTEKKAKQATLNAPPSRPQTEGENSPKNLAELAAKDEEITKLNQLLVDSQNHIQQLKTDLQRHSEEQEVQVTKLSESLTAKDKALAKLQQEFEQKDTQIQENQAENQTLEKQLEEQYARVSSLAKEVAQQKNQVAELDKLQAQLEQAQAHGDRLQKQLEQAQIQTQQAQQQSADLVSQKQQLQAQLKTLDTEKVDLAEQLQAAHQQQQELQERLGAIADLTDKLEASKRQIAELEAKIETLNTTQVECIEGLNFCL